MAAPSPGRPGLALRAGQLPVRLHRGADERRAGYQHGPAHRPGPLRAADEPARRRAAAAGTRSGTRPAAGRRDAVTVAAVLLVYAAGVGTAGSRLLGRASWAVRAPLLGIVIYLAAAWSVLAALGLAGLTLAVHATALGNGLSHLIGACVLRLRDTYATPGGATVAGLGLTLAGAVMARTALTAATHLHAIRQQAV